MSLVTVKLSIISLVICIIINLREEQIDRLKRSDLSVKGSGTVMSDLGSNPNITAFGLTE